MGNGKSENHLQKGGTPASGLRCLGHLGSVCVGTLSCTTTTNGTSATDLVEMDHPYLSYKHFFAEKPGAKQCSPSVKTINLETECEFACVLGIDVFGTKV